MTAAAPTAAAGATDAAHPAGPPTTTIRNPVLPGFHPDPSILRVGGDYYIATSTFEWLPGVTLHHSTDLVGWRPLGGALGETRLLDLVGAPDSGGVWAPCLSWTDGLFHLVYSDVKSLAGAYKDVHNYVVTAPTPQGPWSDPAPLPGHGFDPSLFHDDGPDGDGRSWLLWLEWDHRPGGNPFSGILLQEYDRAARRVTGPVHRIFAGTELGCTEGPHLYRHDGWYYLLTAEGGTSWGHAVTVARSRSLAGPYEADPAGPLLTSAGRPELALQKAGHGSLVETPDGEWYLAHLASRPLTPLGACVLGRETALQRITWTAGGWPRLAHGGSAPALETPAPRAARPGPAPVAAPAPVPAGAEQAPAGPAGFGTDRPGPEWMTLRRHPDPSWLAVRDGRLLLRGDESPASRHRQSLLARRCQDTGFTFDVTVAAAPVSARQAAGLVHLYNTELWHYLHLSWDEALGRVLRVGVCDRGRYSEPAAPVAVGAGRLRLRLSVAGAAARFAWAPADTGHRPREIGPELDAARLSDDYATVGDEATGHYTGWGFTGAFVGVSAQDLTGARLRAEFSAPVYRPAGPPTGPRPGSGRRP
ncbi:glycoside hydrolase family 43 protein [Kitasatospora indigofera]|uniref:glycoside hydrolase family 43 protein n=1 Tax=Kitasatospora indigofera TaxID=67307 RepID=UPI00363383F2